MKTNMKVLLTAAGLSEIFSGFSASSMKAAATEDLEKKISETQNKIKTYEERIAPFENAVIMLVDKALKTEGKDSEIVNSLEEHYTEYLTEWDKIKEDYKDLTRSLKYLLRRKYEPSKDKWQLTLDYIMIAGKYYGSNNDFINTMKVCKKYKELVLMYKFNPISDISLFENIQTQHFYKEEDIKNKKEGLFRYIYWYLQNYEDIKDKEDNEIFKDVVLKRCSKEGQSPLAAIENGKCIVPEGITMLGRYCFADCSKLKEKTMKKIGGYCLCDCSKLTNITLPSSLKEIGDYAFYNTKISTIIIPEGVTKIGDSAFRNTKISTIIIPEGVTKIGSYCFCYCTELTNITLPSSLKEIEKNTFYNANISTIIIPEGITRIGSSCFCECSKLTNITLPSSLKETGINAFSETKISTIIIPEGITKIDDSCFYKCSELTNITLPSSLKEIGGYAFYNTKISTIIIPEGVTKIDESCFSCCAKLTNITLPSSLKGIGSSAFYNTKISTIIIPEGVTKIGEFCFYKCSELTNITLPSSLKEIGSHAFKNAKISTIIIPEGVTKIGWECFRDCSELTNITLPSSLKEIGKSAFYYTKLSDITVSKGCKYWGSVWRGESEFCDMGGVELQDGDLIEGKTPVHVQTAPTLPSNIQGTTYGSDSNYPNTLEPLGEGESNEDD